jgi:glycosyltransferase involved in cell wall biosynthesis
MSPKVVACTPTKNRRWAFEFSNGCLLSQTLKPDLWIIVDNSTRPADDWSIARDLSYVHYHRIFEEKPIGWLRNRCLELALEHGADYIVFWDDDDYYPPTRISSGVRALEADPTLDMTGSSLMYLLLTRENVLMTTGPFHDLHATAATHTIRRRYAETHRFDPEKARGEEVTFTKGWTAKLKQIPAEDTIVVMGHSRNTVDKSQLLLRPQMFNAKVVNDINGKMAFRSRWPIEWGLWRRTFVDEAPASLPDCIPWGAEPPEVHPTARTEGTATSSEHRA